MTKKHYIQIAICSLVIVICGMLFYGYYRDYIAPDSYVVGNAEEVTYKELKIADYISDGDVIFSQNINDKSFAKDGDRSVYEYNFEAKEFDGVTNDYLIFVNDYMLNDISSNAGTITGKYILNYYDINKDVLCSSEITIDFSFYSLASTLKVSVSSDELGYLMNYFKTDDFIITLSKSPFKFENNIKTEEEKQYCTITYMVNDEIYGTQLYEQYTEVSLLQCNEEGFVCWMSGDKYVPDNFIITKDEVLVAYIETGEEDYVTATFKVGDEIFKQLNTTNGYITETISEPIVEGYEFEYWSIDGISKVSDINSYKLTEDTTFIALFRYWEEVENRNPGQMFYISGYNQSQGYLFTTTDSEAREFTSLLEECFQYETSQMPYDYIAPRLTISYAWFDEGANYYVTTEVFTSVQEAQASLTERGESAIAVVGNGVDSVVYFTFKYQPPLYTDGTAYEGYLTQEREIVAYIEKLEICHLTTNVKGNVDSSVDSSERIQFLFNNGLKTDCNVIYNGITYLVDSGAHFSVYVHSTDSILINTDSCNLRYSTGVNMEVISDGYAFSWSNLDSVEISFSPKEVFGT